MVRDLLRRLADRETSDLPVLSVYLDMRQQATGESPGRRTSLTVLRDRLRDIQATLGPRGDDVDSLEADVERIQAFLDDDFDRAAQGLAIFACSGTGLWETLETGTPFEDQVSAGSVPELFQLARLLDEQQTAIVAVVDSNTARLFVSRTGRLDEVEGPDDDPVHYRKRDSGGWSQARYQRHIDKHHADFAAEAAAAIEGLVEAYSADRLVVAGDEVAVSPLLQALPAHVSERLGDVLRIDIRAPRDQVADEVEPVLRQMEAEASAEAADALVSAVRSGGLGTAGYDATVEAAGNGQVDRLVIASDAPLDEEARNDLIRLVTQSAGEIEVVEDHPGLARMGGVGALLRYRLD
ncbi:Vms1/Ankzf1 family peptidyl-tRNA hydrolase [soil metagenome]